MNILIVLGSLLAAYLAGSVNFAIILFSILGKGDPRKGFSGNAGTTNVYRQAGLPWAALILILDVGRAVAVAALAAWLLPADAVPWAGLGMILGNRFPCFHGFKGGKGVANYLGFTAFLSPLWAAGACLAWVTVYGVVRIPFIASFFMVAVLGAGMIAGHGMEALAMVGTAATLALLLVNHAGNVRGLINRDSENN